MQASSSFALDGSGTGGAWNGGSYTVTLSTSSSHDVIIAFVTTYIGNSPVSAAGISSAHLTFSKRVLASNDGNENLEEWFAVATSALSSETITVTLTATGYSTATIFGVSGANTGSPFDSSSGVPSTDTFGNSVPQVTGVTTSNANDMIISGYGTRGSVGPVAAGTGYTIIHQGSQPQVIGAEYEVVTSVLSSATVGWTNNANFGAIIVDAVVAGATQATTTTATSSSSSATTTATSSASSSSSTSTTSSPTTSSASSTTTSSTSTSSSSNAQLALDGSGTGGVWGGTSYTVTLSTNSSPDVIIAFVTTYVGNSPISASSITSAHLTFTKRVLVSYPGNENLEEWYAIASGSLSNEVITVTLSSSAHSTASAFGISGANTVTPFDPNTSLPATNTIESVTPPTCADSSLSTSNPNDMILCAYGTKGGLGSVTTTSGFTLIADVRNPQVIGTEYEVVSSTLSSASITWVNNGNAGEGIADAIMAGSTSTTTTTTPSTTSASSSATTSTALTTSSSVSSTSTTSLTTSTSTANNQDWLSLTHDNNNSRYQAAGGVTSSNVGTLSEKWFYPTSYSVTSTPVVLNGNVYFADWGGNIYSVKVSDGSLNWKYHVSHAVSSSLLLANGLVYVGWGPFGPTSILALDQGTGALVWSKTLTTQMHAIWASPIVYNGRLFIGVAAADNDSEGVSAYKGEIDALDAMTGSLDWNFKTAIGTAGGASVWGSVAVDPTLDSIYFGTGNAFGAGTGAAILYSYSIISLSATSGTLNWYHQVYADTTTGGDLDFGSTPNLFTLSYNGNMYRAVGIGAKDGNYYIVDRTNGNLIVEETVGTLDNMGIIGIGGFYYPSTQGNPELFIPSSNYPTCTPNCKGVVEALFPSSGKVAWTAYSPGLIVGSVAVVPGAVLFGDIYGFFYAVSIADGSALFHTQVSPFGINGGITVAEGYVLFGNGAQSGSKSGYGLYAFAPSGLAAPSHSNSLSLTIQNWSPEGVVLLAGVLSSAIMILFEGSKSGAKRKQVRGARARYLSSKKASV